MAAAQKNKCVVDRATLEAFASELLRAGGFAPEHAAQTAELLVWANLRAVDSHGVLRIPRYVEMVELGIINPKAEPHFVTDFGAISVLDADRVPGAVAMNMATARAMALAAENGIGWCAARNITHAGAIGFYAQKAARSGLLAIVMTASKPLMIYHGSSAEGVSTNPIAIAAPTADPDLPMVLDMSTASVAAGKITAAKDAGLSIPLGWGVDRDGRDTTDPNAVKSVLPMAGPKGSGLSLLIEVLTSVLVGNPIIARALNGKGDAGGNGAVLAIDPVAFGSGGAFAHAVDELFRAIKRLPPAPPASAVQLPGERGSHEMAKRAKDGIPLAEGTLSRLVALSTRLGVPVPPSLR